MTAEELIIGHFDQSLTAAEQAELTTLIDSSSDVRTLYEQHRTIHEKMLEEKTELAPSSSLDDAVVAAALGAMALGTAEVVTSGLLGKIAASVAVVAVGGLSYMLVTKGPDEAEPVRPATAPVERRATTTDVPKPQLPVEQPAATTATDAPTSRADASTPVGARDAAGHTSRPASASTTQPNAQTPSEPSEPQQPKINLNRNDGPVIQYPAEVKDTGSAKGGK